MNNFDFDVCRKEIDRIKLSENQKRKLIKGLQNADDETEISDFVKPKSHFKSIALVASFLVIMLGAVFFINSTYPVYTPYMKDFKMSVSLSEKNKNGEEITDSATAIAVGDDIISVGKGKVKLTPLDFQIEGTDIEKVDISSDMGNIITCTYKKKSGKVKKETKRTKYNNLVLSEISSFGWMPSDKNIAKAEKRIDKEDNSKYYFEYLSDIIDVTVYCKNGEVFKKQISVSYDRGQNYIIKFKE